MSLLIKCLSLPLIVLYNLLALHQNVFQMTTHFVLLGLLCLLPVDPAEHWENTRTTGKIQQQIYLFLPNFTMLMLTSNKPHDFNFHPIQTWHCPFDLALIWNVIPSCKATFKTTSNLTGLHQFMENSKQISPNRNSQRGEAHCQTVSLGLNSTQWFNMHLSFGSCPFFSCAQDSVYESGWNRLSKVKLRLTVVGDS